MDGDTKLHERQPAPEAYRSLASLEADDATGGGWKRWLWIGGALVALGALGFLGWTLFSKHESPPQRVVITQVTRVTLPPPPPPPPPPKVDPPPEPAQRVQESVRPEPKPEAKPPPPAPRPAAPPGPPAGLGLPTGPGGANPYGIGAGGDGYVVGGGGSGGGGDAQRYFHQQATQRVADALKRDERTRGGSGVVALTFDDSGRVLRVRLARGTGDAARDRAIIEVLTGLSIARPPPGNRTLSIELNENV